MRIYKNSFLAILLSVSLFACNQEEKVTTEDGTEYFLLKKGSGEKYAQGDFGTFYLKFVNEQDSVLIDSKDVGLMAVQIDTTSMKSRGMLFSILLDLNEGDSVKTKLPASEVFTKAFRQPLSKGITPNDRITVYASATQLLDSAGFMNWRKAEREKQMAKMAEEAMKAKAENVKKVQEYISENNLKVDSTENGLYYTITQEGNGIIPETGQMVSVNYVGKLLDGKVFDTSYEAIAKENSLFNPQRTYEPYTFELGTRSIIQGWNEAFSVLSEGAKATLIIPSDLGYGPRGSGVIPPNAVLVFDVELVEIKK